MLAWAICLALQDPAPPKLEFETLAGAQPWFSEGHFKSPPPPLKPWIGRWVTIEGFFFVNFDGGELKDAFVSAQFSDPAKGIEPTDPFARVRIEFREGALPADFSTRWLAVSGTFGLRRFDRNGELVALFCLTDAVAGARRPPADRAVSSERLSFALLESSRATAKGDDLDARPYDVKDIGPMPAPLAAFDGRWVSMTGNLFVPYPADRVRQVILAKNPWDGCCFGVPPNIWDSIVVVFADEIPMANPAPRFMTASGRLRIEIQRDAKSGLVTRCFELREAVPGNVPDPSSGESGSGPVLWIVGGAAALLAAGLILFRLRPRRN